MADIKELGGLPSGEILLAVERGDTAVRDFARDGDAKVMQELGGRMSKMETRLSAVESGLTEVGSRLSGVESQATEAVTLGRQAVAQNQEILTRLHDMEGEQHRQETETADGRKVIEVTTRWRQTAKDFHIDKLLAFGWKIFLLWGAFKLAGWIGGPLLRDKLFEIIKHVL